MKVVIPHDKTLHEAIDLVDRSADHLFDYASGGAVELTDRKKGWDGPKMDFSLIARVGFVALPIAGVVLIDEIAVTVDCELPQLVKMFVGEDKIRDGVEKKVRGILANQNPGPPA
jgi:hypothetical protein